METKWRKAVIVPLPKHKVNKNKCNNHRSISLFYVSGNYIYGRVLTEKLMQITEEKVSDEEGSFRKGKGE